MTDVFDHAPQVWNAAQLRAALEGLPGDTPIHIGVAEDPGDFGGYRESVLVDAHRSLCRLDARRVRPARLNPRRRRRRTSCRTPHG
ncbi:DUF6225 family protein [Streptomyces sp. NBC_00378]|uniref:DUF6225 family protein n=1 Tax=unclassified Streptomyces TaxID=2593676 RepID=UPI002251D844|nr:MULTISPECIES: DUF6225 family protein [unclassified Streptomyces]MCX5115317.1 DUF6225 family protein [Streptomyces sp. NBC_00378]